MGLLSLILQLEPSMHSSRGDLLLKKYFSKMLLLFMHNLIDQSSKKLMKNVILLLSLASMFLQNHQYNLRKGRAQRKRKLIFRNILEKFKNNPLNKSYNQLKNIAAHLGDVLINKFYANHIYFTIIFSCVDPSNIFEISSSFLSSKLNLGNV